MAALSQIEEVRHKHDKLFSHILEIQGDHDRSKKINKDLLKEASLLVQELQNIATIVKSLDDYRWVTDALLKWQIVVTNIFNEPIDTVVPMPPESLALPSELWRPLQQNEVDYWITALATHRSAMRQSILHRESTPEEENEDRHIAEVFFASDVLDGKINFASRISSDTYGLLESVWLPEVKSLRAYLNWKADEPENGEIAANSEYFTAIEHFRRMLVDSGIKAKKSEFDSAEYYIFNKYLTEGVLNTKKKSDAHKLVSRKANRIFHPKWRNNHDVNWAEAVTYCKSYYENIIPAVKDDDYDAILRVLKAFQFSEIVEKDYSIANAFELSLAIYFINMDIIKKIWMESKNKAIPKSALSVKVAVEAWPENYKVPDSCIDYFQVGKDEVRFFGIMSEQQKDDLQADLAGENQYVIDKLYEKSRLLPRNRTL